MLSLAFLIAQFSLITVQLVATRRWWKAPYNSPEYRRYDRISDRACYGPLLCMAGAWVSLAFGV